MTRIKSSILTARFGASSKRRIFARYVVKLIKFHLTVLISREKRYVDYDLTKAVRGEADSATFIFLYIYTKAFCIISLTLAVTPKWIYLDKTKLLK